MTLPWKWLGVLAALALVLWLALRDRPDATGGGAPALPERSSADMLEPAPAGALERPRAERTPREEVAGSAAATAADVPLDLLLVDELTREPLAHAEAGLYAGEELLERVRSDAHGRLRGTALHPPGRYELDLSAERRPEDRIQTRAKEARALSPRVAFELAPARPGAPPLEVAVAAGPAFALAADWPAGFSPVSFSATLACADTRLAFDRLHARVQEGPPAWVRFSPLARFASGGPPWKLQVTSEDALWSASATLPALAGSARTPLTLVFEARARLVGRVLDADGKPLAGAWIEAWPPGASFDSPDVRPSLVPTQEDGRFDLRAVAPGRYRLATSAKGWLPYSAELDVPALLRTEHEIRLARPDPATLGSITGRVTSRSGRHAEKLLVLLAPRAPPREGETARVAWSGGEGAQSGSFEFKDLVPGEYELELVPASLVRIVPRKLVVRPSAAPLEFVVEDAGAEVELAVRALADEDQKPLQGFRVSAALAGSEERANVTLQHGETEAILRHVPLGATVELRLEAPERQMHWTRVVAAEKPLPLLVRLARGWGAEFSVLGPALEPLAGARVFLDEELAGTSDAQGLLRAAWPKVPQRCRVEYQDWRMAPGGEVSPETGLFRAWQGWIQVRMGPAK